MVPLFKKKQDDEKAHKPDRKDKKIKEELESRFFEEKYLKEQNIQFDVRNGIVTLVGAVTSPLVQNLAEEIAAGVPGVEEVQSNITLGFGRPGEDTTEEHISSSDFALSEDSNTGDPNLNHPTTTGFTEVPAETREDVLGGMETGITADQAAQMAIPATGEGSSVMDAGEVDAIKVSGSDDGEEALEHVLTSGLPVVDRDGKSVGKVKEVRSTDFLLGRTLARNIYVPYFACTYDGEKVTINVLADEIADQGWAMPKLF